MGSPVSTVDEKDRGFVVDFLDGEKILSGSLLHITSGPGDREPVALIKCLTGDRKGSLVSVGISRLIVP